MYDILWQLLLQVLLIGLNAVFACAEIAVLSVNETKLERMAAEGNRKAARLRKLTVQPARFLATIQVAITLSGFLGSAFAADNFSELLVNWLVGLGVGIPAKTLDTISVILITIILSYFTLVFGELVPKRLAMKKSEQLALGMSGLITTISKFFAPLVWLLTVSVNGVLRLLHVDPDGDEEEVSEEEIRMMVDVGGARGAIDREEQSFIQNVFEFDDLTAGEIATHRTEVDLLWLDESQEQWAETIRGSRHNLYPVCQESVDQVVGVLNTKDYFRLTDHSLENVLDQAVKPAYFVPETVKADVLFRNMKSSRNRFAVVLDEYGGLSGIVTINDLLEQLVGDFDDEGTAEEEAPEVERVDSQTWRIQGTAPLDDVAQELDVTLPLEEYDTFGGLVFGALGAIPMDGAQPEVDVCGLHVKVQLIRDHRIQRALVCRLEPQNGEETE